MATKTGSWKVVKTSGGYGVLKKTGGAKLIKKTVVRPATISATHAKAPVRSA